ncbi:hypothetical protein NEISICOT_01127 [Neisseria sicca ATCC 29256]|uniref:Uncharacterized protein n=1 Tax=Neisseria sicca ATCC 29256 TaxID=547045 RepID=C6M3H9_NEISI|nr:hypothetical protein NEISICOT_01127 [Neisseria sicca ATCC 29256]
MFFILRTNKTLITTKYIQNKRFIYQKSYPKIKTSKSQFVQIFVL